MTGVQTCALPICAIEQWDYSANAGREDYHGYLARKRSFVYGQPFELAIQFGASSNNAGPLADYFNTMTFSLADSRVLTASGALVDLADCQVTSMSGHDYLVPEPATVALLGVAGLFAGRRRAR